MKRKSFVSLPKPIVCCILQKDSAEASCATMRNGEFAGAQAFAVYLEAWRAEDLTDDHFRRIADATSRPVMFIRYRSSDRWPCPLDDDGRIAMLTRAVACGGAAIDIPADTFDPSPRELSVKPEAVDKQRRAIDEVHKLGGEVVMSSHIYEPRACGQVVEHLKAVEARGVDIAKIVTLANTDEEFVEAVKTTLALRKEMKVPFIHLIGGKFALPHRYLSPTLGNALTFCVERYTPAFITPQPPLGNMLAVLNHVNWHIDW